MNSSHPDLACWLARPWPRPFHTWLRPCLPLPTVSSPGHSPLRSDMGGPGVWVQVCVCAHMSTYMYGHAGKHVHACASVYVCVHVDLCLCMCACMCLCACARMCACRGRVFPTELSFLRDNLTARRPRHLAGPHPRSAVILGGASFLSPRPGHRRGGVSPQRPGFPLILLRADLPRGVSHGLSVAVTSAVAARPCSGGTGSSRSGLAGSSRGVRRGAGAGPGGSLTAHPVGLARFS